MKKQTLSHLEWPEDEETVIKFSSFGEHFFSECEENVNNLKKLFHYKEHFLARKGPSMPINNFYF